MKKLATLVVTVGVLAVGTMPAQAMYTSDADATFGTTKCGAYQYGGSDYTYQMEKDIPISSAAWGRLLANDPYGLKVQDNVWQRVAPKLGEVFPLVNFTSQKMKTDNYGNPYFDYSNANTAMNNATCGSKFWVSAQKGAVGVGVLAVGGPHAGRMEVVQTRSNGISFRGTEGVMKGAGMNFRVVSGASRTFLNVHVTGPTPPSLVEGWLRDMMKSFASTEWQNFANNIGAAQ